MYDISLFIAPYTISDVAIGDLLYIKKENEE